MYCSNCGIQNEDGKNFCENCGAPLMREQGGAASENNLESLPQAALPAEPTLLGEIRKIITSKLFLVAAILLSVSIFASVLSVATAPLTSAALLQTIEELEFPEEFDEIFPMEEIEELLESGMLEDILSASTSSSIMSQIIPILTAVGLWMLYSSAKKNNGPISPSGVKMIKVLETINLVMAEIAAVALLVVGILLPYLVQITPDITYEVQSIVTIVAVVFCIIMFITFAIVTVVYIFTLKALGSAIKLLSGEPTFKGMNFVMVICFATGFINVTNSFSFVFAPLSFISSAAMGAAYILFGLLISKLKTAVTPFTKPFYSEYVAPENQQING